MLALDNSGGASGPWESCGGKEVMTCGAGYGGMGGMGGGMGGMGYGGGGGEVINNYYGDGGGGMGQGGGAMDYGGAPTSGA